MSVTIGCWNCDKDTGISRTNYGDHRCPHCGVMISIYDPVHPDWMGDKKETDMAINYNDEKYASKFVYLPRVGESAEFHIKDIHEKKCDNPKLNFSQKVPVMANGEPVIDDEGEPVTKDKDLGYHVECDLMDGKILSITSLAAFLQVLKKHGIQDGDNIRVDHKEKGVWEVTKL